ncbi:MAG: pyridoxamine 5'-phosphate oxidase family protein [Actinomycetota bacterium]|nr:pyridoxamine 5'-phosphate oxidase family protein [Actinomycetota bacterium]
MGRTYEALSDALVEWIGRQKMFFVATAPERGGHVNLSPKGYDSFRILDERTVAYLDLTGSGVETIAHLRENGRISVMFCAFEGPPRIVRLQGLGEVVAPGDDGFAELASGFPDHRGARAVVRIGLDRIADSCGYSVPLMDYVGERSRLAEWADNRSDDELVAYRAEKNAKSIDGLPALPADDAVTA